MEIARSPDASTVGWTATDIAQHVRSGAVSPVEVVRQHLDHIEANDGRIGAFQHLRAQAALREAAVLAQDPRLATLPLAGVPVAIKDNIPVAGAPMRCGSAATSQVASAADHEVVRRLRVAGAIVVGLTRVPELSLWPFTDGALGTARNPWNTERTPGGSSGGSAAAVAAGMVPIAHGNDALGSVRIPAAACGLVGWKPGDGVVPADVGNGSWFGMAVNGVLATTAADAALMASVMAGRPDLASPVPTAALRIGVATESPVPGARTEAAVAAAVQQVAATLRAAGHKVEAMHLQAPTGVALSVFAHWFAAAAMDAELLAAPMHMLPATRRHVAIGRIVQRLKLVRPGARERWRERFQRMLGDCDLLLTPVTTRTAIAATGWTQKPWREHVRCALAFAPFTGAANFAGLPAIAVPAGMHEGLPVGAQFIGRAGSEALLLAIAQEIERERPWPRHAGVR